MRRNENDMKNYVKNNLSAIEEIESIKTIIIMVNQQMKFF